jgi:hypothetical protein
MANFNPIPKLQLSMKCNESDKVLEDTNLAEFGLDHVSGVGSS